MARALQHVARGVAPNPQVDQLVVGERGLEAFEEPAPFLVANSFHRACAETHDCFRHGSLYPSCAAAASQQRVKVFLVMVVGRDEYEGQRVSFQPGVAAGVEQVFFR